MIANQSGQTSRGRRRGAVELLILVLCVLLFAVALLLMPATQQLPALLMVSGFAVAATQLFLFFSCASH